jgi:glycine cleavage system T protein
MAKQSPLTELHRAHGAVFAERDGWLLPMRFGNPESEYQAVRSGVGLIDLSHRALLQLTGPDRFSFLQGMVSNDLRSLAPGAGQHAAVLNQQGKVLSDVRILCSENSFYLELWEFVKDKIVEHLNRYLVADEVEIADRSGEYAVFSLQGPHAESLLRKLILGAVAPLERPLQHTIVDIGGAKACLVKDDPTGEAGFDLIMPRIRLLDFGQRAGDAGQEFFTSWIGEEAQNSLRIEAGIPLYGTDFTEDSLLLEVELKDAVSFTKGCYLGQEVVERIRSRGHVNKKLTGLLLDSQQPAPAGALMVVADREIGNITSSVYSPRLGRAIALGYVHKDFWNPGTKLTVKTNGEPTTATVTERPFVRATPESGS